jgi:DNA-binding NarL/FixJ family response regulator
MIKIGIVDDHQLFLKSVALLIASIPDCTIVVEALNGKDLIDKFETKPGSIPDILFVDVNMPVMDGPATAAYMHKHYPQIKTVALSMKDDDATIISMLREGCCAYLLKDIHPDELEKALHEINKKGYYNSDASNINFRRLLLHTKKEEALHLTEKEQQFLQLACSEFTYKQIANAMHISERTVDGYREIVFEKLNVQSRVGMVLEALRRNLVTL